MAKSVRSKQSAATLYLVGTKCGWRCYICEGGYDRADEWQIEHRQTLADGGSDDLSNKALAHRSCNLIKGRDSFL